jgi:serine/threonine protein kinase
MHCDIKDDNIMWDRATDTVQLIDFEFAIELNKGCTFGLNSAGTPLFMSPELLEYHTHPKWSAATNKSDIISAGLVCAGLMYGVRIRCEEEREWVLHELRNRAVSAVSSELAVNLLLAMTSAEGARPSAEACLTYPFLASSGVVTHLPCNNTERMADATPIHTAVDTVLLKVSPPSNNTPMAAAKQHLHTSPAVA